MLSVVLELQMKFLGVSQIFEVIIIFEMLHVWNPYQQVILNQ